MIEPEKEKSVKDLSDDQDNEVTEIIYKNEDLKKDEISDSCLDDEKEESGKDLSDDQDNEVELIPNLETVEEDLTFEEVDKFLEHQNSLDNEITFNITKEENELVEITTNQNNHYLQFGEENYHIIIDEVERCYIEEVPKIMVSSDNSDDLPYEPPPPYEKLASSQSSTINFDEFKKFLLRFHENETDPSDPLWEIEDLKEFEEMYKKTYKKTTQVQYTSFINYVTYVQQNNNNQDNNNASEDGFFASFRKFVETIVVNVAVGNKAANERLRRLSHERLRRLSNERLRRTSNDFSEKDTGMILILI